MMEGRERDLTTFLIWHRMLATLPSEGPLQGLYQRSRSYWVDGEGMGNE